MKRIIFLMSVCFSILLFSNCTNKDSKIAVSIPDENFKAYLLENFDKNKDGYISFAEAKAVKKIDCSGRNIQSIKGIEKFVNLAYLDCSNNQLDALELRYNKKLNRLIFNDNNERITIYIGMSSPLRIPSIQRPSDNETPQVTNVTNPLDPAKCTYNNSIVVSLSFDD